MTGFTGSEDYHYEPNKKENLCEKCNNQTYTNACPIIEQMQFNNNVFMTHKLNNCIFCHPKTECEYWEPIGLVTVECDPKNDCVFRGNKHACRYCVRNAGKRSIYESKYYDILVKYLKDMFIENQYCCVCGVKITKSYSIIKGKIYCDNCERLAK